MFLSVHVDKTSKNEKAQVAGLTLKTPILGNDLSALETPTLEEVGGFLLPCASHPGDVIPTSEHIGMRTKPGTS